MERMNTYQNHVRRRAALSQSVLIAGLVLFLFGCRSSREDKLHEAAKYADEARQMFDEEKYGAALLRMKDAVAINTEASNDTALAENNLLVARCYQQLGEYDSALTHYQNAIERSHALSDRNRERAAQIALAEFHLLMNRDIDALAVASDAATSAKLFTNVHDAYAALLVVATASHKLQRYDQEIKAIEELLVFDSLGQKEKERNRLYASLFRAVSASHKGMRSIEVLSRWMDASKRLGDDKGIALARYELGRYYVSAERSDSALRAFSSAMEKLANIDDRLLQSDVWIGLGNVAYSQHQYENARGYFSNALERAGQPGGVPRTQLLRLAIVACEFKQNPASRSAELIAQASAIGDSCKKNGYLHGAAFAFFLKGVCQDKLNGSASAIQSFQEAVRIIDQTMPGDNIDGQDFIDVFLREEKTDWYSTLLQGECTRNNVDSAFTVAEQKNLRDLVDFYSHITFVTRNPSVGRSVEELQQRYNEGRLREHDIVDELEHSHRKTNERLTALTGRAGRCWENITSSIQALKKVSPNFARLLSLEPLALNSIRGALPPQTALVEFAPTANALYSIVVRPETSVIRRANATGQYLNSIVRDYLQLISELRLTTYGLRMSEPAALQRINELSSVLHTILIAPILADIRDVQKLYVVLPAEFAWLPVHTLRGEGSVLGIRTNVSYLPTAAALLFPQDKERWVKKIIGLGHPGTTSWDVEYELKDIRSFFDGVGLLFDTAATLSHLLDSTYDILHIAAEAYLDRPVPQNSHAVLADEARPVGLRNVPLGEMLKMPAPRTFVFSNISATPGGLSRYAPLAFLANGTRTVIVSMWQGDRRAKKAFGEGFYTNLFAALPASDAYYKAIGAMAKQDEMSHIQRWGMYYQFGR